MKPFMDKDFILGTETAKALYHNAAKHEPIYDYHCHLPPAQIAGNKKFSDLTEIWLGGDHYKWRQMRCMGIDEKYITGDAEPYEKFLAWTRTVENLIGNPLYHWTHLELQRYFDIYEPLTEKTAKNIWERANEKLQLDELSVRGIFEKFKVYAVGTTDDPADNLEYHRAIAEGTAPIGFIKTRVIPSFRPDKALNINLPSFRDYIAQLSKASGTVIDSLASLKDVLEKRLEFFIQHGCRASDHALEYPPFENASDAELDAILKKALDGSVPSKEEADAFKTHLLVFLAKLYTRHDIVMQLHLASIRNNNTRAFKVLGPDTGYDASHDHQVSRNLSSLLDTMESEECLPKTILYTLNPKDYYPLLTLRDCYQAKDVFGKIQLGSAWWFCDHRDGMEEQMRLLGNVGMLSAFVGMLTDSRSFLSYPRHEYFRRILCNMIGNWVENGEFPHDTEKLSEIVRNISFQNAMEYFK